jgi:phage tail sheath protein FI
MAEYKTPGVYIIEKNAFPNSVVEVPTAVPAFIGCTEKALRGAESLAGIPTRITSLAEYNKWFGGAPPLTLTFKPRDDDHPEPYRVEVADAQRFYFYNSLRMFFDNGGGPCYIVSVDTYKQRLADSGMPNMKLDDLVKKPLEKLLKYQEPTMIVVPDLVLLPKDSWGDGVNAIIQHCVKMQSRIGIFDVYNGNVELTADGKNVIEEFRSKVVTEGDKLNYGVAYYPWLNSSIVEASDIHFGLLDSDGRSAMITYLKGEVASQFPKGTDGKTPLKAEALNAQLDKMADYSSATDAGLASIKTAHAALKTALKSYEEVVTAMQKAANLLPPSGGMAGVYTRTDNNQGVFKAPANAPILSVVSPTVDITHDAQEDLNVPLDGKAINAIRTFPGRGMLIWGARTLDGNSQDWRYINVRRTMIMLEQSIKTAVETYMFAANTAQTWTTVKSMIVNFLTNKWKEGALQGASAEEAFSVDVGLGNTMDANDILDGYMRVLVKVAVVRPAEFIVLTFQQQMAKS